MLVMMTRRKKRQRNDRGLSIRVEHSIYSRREMDPDEIEICKAADGSDWLLGSGSFGQVYKGMRRGVQEVAVKKMVRTTAAAAGVWLRVLVKEIDILKQVSFDRNIVQYYGACLQDQASAMLVMEYMEVRICHLPWMLPFSVFCLWFCPYIGS